jgi:3-oxoacyl-[acyl-carrier-protein] synthase III
MIQVCSSIASTIVGLGSYLPQEVLTNDDIAEMMDTTDEWIRGRTGVGARHHAAPNETTASIGTAAAKAAIEDAGIDSGDIDMIIMGTMFPDYTYPGPGMVIQHRLGMNRTVPVFDIRVQCVGFIYALSMADLYIRSGQAKHVLIVFSEKEFDHLKVDRQIGVIFGDGAGAAVVGVSSGEQGLIATDLDGDGSGVQDLVMTSDNMVGLKEGKAHWPEELRKTKEYWDERGFIEGYTKFPFWVGPEVFRNAVKRLTRSVRGILGASDFAAEDIERFFFHQANARINAKLAEVLHLPKEKIPTNIERIGNVGAGSIPVLMCEEKKAGRLNPGDTCLLAAFGAGYLWGSAILKF